MTSFPPTTQSPVPPDMQQHETDLSHLKTLAIFYWVFAGLSVLGLFCGGLYMIMGAAVLAAPAQGGSQADADAAKVMGGGILVVGLIALLFTILGIVLNCMTASSLRSQRRYMLCVIWAALTCLSIPLGTILGVFTLIVLNRPSVKTMFGR